MRIWNGIWAAALSLAFVSALGVAPAAAADPLITQFTTQNVSDVLKELGATEIKTVKGDDGTDSVSFTYDSGPFLFSIINCKKAPCHDLQMAIFYEKDAAFTPGFANTFNGKWLDATAIALADGTLMMNRLVIANGGVTKENLRENMSIFVNVPNLIADQLKAVTTVSAPPAAGTTFQPAVAPAPVQSGVDRQAYVPAKVDKTLLRRYLTK
jgi:hypothetical protein